MTRPHPGRAAVHVLHYPKSDENDDADVSASALGNQMWRGSRGVGRGVIFITVFRSSIG